MISAIQTGLSGLAAATKQVEASADNIANLQTAGSLNGSPAPYTPVTAVQTSNGNGGVSVALVPKSDPFTPLYSPDSPFANADGIIGVPNVDLASEAVNLKIAEISYKANIATIKAADEMSNDLLRIFDKKA